MLNLPFLLDTNRDGTTGRGGWTGLSRCCDTAPIRSRPSDRLVHMSSSQEPGRPIGIKAQGLSQGESDPTPDWKTLTS